MGFMGGGFFGSGASTTRQSDSHSGDTTAGNEGSVAQSFSNLTTGKNSNLSIGVTDYGSVKSAIGLADKSASLAFDGLGTVANSLNGVAAYGYDLTKKILDTHSNDMESMINANGKTLSAGLDFARSTSSDFLNLTSDSQKLTAAQDRYFLDGTMKENADNRAMLADANRSIADAWKGSNNNMMQLTDAFMGRQAAVQDNAIAAIMKGSASAQDATLKAMNGIFESSKSSTERVIDSSLKYIVFGVMALFAIPFVAGIIKK